MGVKQFCVVFGPAILPAPDHFSALNSLNYSTKQQAVVRALLYLGQSGQWGLAKAGKEEKTQQSSGTL